MGLLKSLKSLPSLKCGGKSFGGEVKLAVLVVGNCHTEFLSKRGESEDEG